MDDELKLNLLARLARTKGSARVRHDTSPASILALSAVAYGARPSDDATVPTGFDPLAIALFEALVESAFLVATADEHFDDDERAMFERVVIVAAGGAVAPGQIAALLSDFADQLAEDGLDRRVDMISRLVTKKDHAREILRVGALLGASSEGVSDVERHVLTKLALACGLDAGAVDAAIDDVQAALSTA